MQKYPSQLGQLALIQGAGEPQQRRPVNGPVWAPSGALLSRG